LFLNFLLLYFECTKIKITKIKIKIENYCYFILCIISNNIMSKIKKNIEKEPDEEQQLGFNYEEPECYEIEQYDEEYIKKQKKICLTYHCGLDLKILIILIMLLLIIVIQIQMEKNNFII
jgi:hypothetical protein